MKLEVGMYVRTDRGNIFKVENVFEIDVDGTWFKSKVKENSVIKDLPRFMYDEEDEIINKASHNIIDLIEVGDYVNGYMITDFSNEYYDEELDDYVEGFSIVLGNEEQMYSIPPKDIETVLTKEQFEAMQYKVVEE